MLNVLAAAAPVTILHQSMLRQLSQNGSSNMRFQTRSQMLLRVKSKAVCLLVSFLRSCSTQETLKMPEQSASVLHLGIPFVQSAYRQQSLLFLLYFLPLLISLILPDISLLVSRAQHQVGSLWDKSVIICTPLKSPSLGLHTLTYAGIT